MIEKELKAKLRGRAREDSYFFVVLENKQVISSAFKSSAFFCFHAETERAKGEKEENDCSLFFFTPFSIFAMTQREKLGTKNLFCIL